MTEQLYFRIVPRLEQSWDIVNTDNEKIYLAEWLSGWNKYYIDQEAENCTNCGIINNEVTMCMLRITSRKTSKQEVAKIFFCLKCLKDTNAVRDIISIRIGFILEKENKTE